MTLEQGALFAKSRRALEAAQASLDRDDAETALNRTYYAAFYAATAALLGIGETPKTHTGAHRRFRLHFADHLPESLRSFLEYAANLRQRADYEALATFDLPGTADLLADAERFVQTVEDLLTDD